MQTFTDMHGHTICDGAELYYNGQFHAQIPTESRIRQGIAIIDGDRLIFAVTINGQLQGIGLYWELDGEPCYDLAVTQGETATIQYRGIVAEISTCTSGYKCVIVDRLGNDVSWFVCANSMPEAIAKAERHFDSAINYLRGFIILPEFLRRVEGLL